MNMIDDFIYKSASSIAVGNRNISHLLSLTFAATAFSSFVAAPNGDRLNQFHLLIGSVGSGKGVNKTAFCQVLKILGEDYGWTNIGSFAGCHGICVETNKGVIGFDYTYPKIRERILPILFTEGGYFEAEIIKSKKRFPDVRRPLLTVLEEQHPKLLRASMLTYCSWASFDWEEEPRKFQDYDDEEADLEQIRERYSISGEEKPIRMLWGKGSIEMYKAIKERLSKEKHSVFDGALSKVFKLACLSDILDQWPAKELSLKGETLEKECLWFMKQAKKVQRFL
jgi:hypothetical protein